jgi:GT2 family glycosyltransferase
MYYEDIDLSLRLRLQGYRITYEPNSIVYHYHSGSSKEGSDFFVFNVEKNFFAVLLKYYPFGIISTEILRYIALTIINFLKMLKWRLLEHWELFEEFKNRLKVRVDVLKWVGANTFQLLNKRSSLRSRASVSIEKVYKDLY